MDWRAKAALQLVLSHLPGGYALNSLLSSLVGARQAPKVKSAVQVRINGCKAMVEALESLGFQVEGRRLLEIGTGWDAIAPIYLSIMGAKVTTMDVYRHLRATSYSRKAIAAFVEVIGEDRKCRANAEQMARLYSFSRSGGSYEQLLAELDIEYLAPLGDDHLVQACGRSVFDACFSIGVLEHVARGDLTTLLEQQALVLKPGGVVYHAIGLGDHFTSVDPSITFLNFVQLEETAWNRWLCGGRLGYHNRLRRSDFMRLFRKTGWDVVWHKARVDDKALDDLMSGRLSIATCFAGYDYEDLATWRLRLVACRDRPSH